MYRNDQPESAASGFNNEGGVMFNSNSKSLRHRSAVVRSAGRVAVVLLAWGAQLPAHAQRYAEGDYTGSLNILVWIVAIAFFILVWLRKRIRHFLNPQRAEAEDKAAEERRLTEKKAFDAEMDARMARIEKADRDR